MEVPPILTTEFIAAWQRARNQIDDAIEVFGREFNNEIGDPISDNSYLAEWELHAGNIHATYEYSDQCGGGKEYAIFPAAALSDAAERQKAIDEGKAKVEAKKRADEEQKLRAAEAEAERVARRIASLRQAAKA